MAKSLPTGLSHSSNPNFFVRVVLKLWNSGKEKVVNLLFEKNPSFVYYDFVSSTDLTKNNIRLFSLPIWDSVLDI
jgi:hypothetical protein